MIDHVAHPSFDAAATHRFYTGVLGARLKTAVSVAEPPYVGRADALEVVERWIAASSTA
jgi:catechol 2,3-dioxygenase-like lactoylglutathione lyase family enzyme